jgi:hypothetical protein
MVEQQTNSVPLSSQSSPSQEESSQEQLESSPSETTEVVLTTDITETKAEDNQELVSHIVEETSESEKVIEVTSESEKVIEITSESEKVIEETSESEKVTEKTSESEQVAEGISESEQVIVNNIPNEQQEEEGVNNKETEYNSSVTDDNIKDPLNIESAQLEISNILNNTTNIENDQSKEASPLLTYVVDSKLDSLTQIPTPSQEGTATMPLKHLEYDIVHATGWDVNYPPHQLLPKDNKNSSNGSIKHGKGWQSER